MKRLVVTILLIVSLLNVAPAKSVPVSDAEALAETADEFFRTWLLRRDVKEAMRYISANPILGTCMTPDYLDEKKVLSRADVLGVFRKAFTHTLKKIPKAKTLSDLIDSSGGIPSEDSNVVFARHRMEQNFQIFTIKPVEDPTRILYICKFDERKSFRETVARPNVYYLVATVKTTAQYDSLDLEILWIKHRGRWRILTISTLED